MFERPATLRDVAELAGVHTSTASRALNPATEAQVSAATLVRVKRVAEELGYRPSPLARGLKTNRTMTVGMLVPDLTNPLFPPIVRGIEDELGREGYILILSNTDNDLGKEDAILAAMLTRKVDGLILATSRRDPEFLTGITQSNRPIVLVNRSVDDRTVPSVVNDDALGIRLVVEHLVGLGHRRIGHVAGPQELSTGHDRHETFLAETRRTGLEVAREHVVFAGSFTEAAGEQACARLLDRAPDLTAVVGGNDLIAIGCLDVLVKRRIRVPEDISVVGYNDVPFVDKLQPPLTTVRIPQYDMGVKAARLMLSMLLEGTRPESVYLPPELIVRRSTGPAAGVDSSPRPTTLAG